MPYIYNFHSEGIFTIGTFKQEIDVNVTLLTLPWLGNFKLQRKHIKPLYIYHLGHYESLYISGQVRNRGPCKDMMGV